MEARLGERISRSERRTLCPIDLRIDVRRPGEDFEWNTQVARSVPGSMNSPSNRDSAQESTQDAQGAQADARETGARESAVGEVPRRPRFGRSGDPDLPTLRSVCGTKLAQLVYFNNACGLTTRMESFLKGIQRKDQAHINTTLGDAGCSLVRTCARCDAIDRFQLPKPVRCMLMPSGVPAGLGDQIWDWMRAFWSVHLRCPGESSQVSATDSSVADTSVADTTDDAPEISDVD